MSFFNKKIWSRQSLASLLILLFLFGLLAGDVLPERKAQAQNATLIQQIISYLSDVIGQALDYAIQTVQETYQEITSEIQQWSKNDVLDQRALKDSWNQTRKQLLDDLSSDVLKWAQGEQGNPNFIQNWPGYLTQKSEQAGQDFINTQLQTQTAQMCPAFGPTVQSDIQTLNKDLSSSGYQATTACPLPSQNGTTQSDFSWGLWQADLLSNSNYYGEFLQSYDELEATSVLAYQAAQAQAIANQGFKGSDKTPGIVQSYATQRASMMDFDYLLNSSDLNTYESSVVDAFINRIINDPQGLAGMAVGSAYTSQCDKTNSNADPSKNCKNKIKIDPTQKILNDIKASHDHLSALAGVLQLIKQDLIAELTEQQLNLAVMQQIKIVQDKDPCGPSTTAIGPEITALQQVASTTSDKITIQVEAAIKDQADLLLAADHVIDVDNSTSTDAQILTDALTDYQTALAKFANDTATGSIQILMNSNQTDLDKLFSEANKYTEQIVKNTAQYTKARGVSQAPRTMPETLYGRLKRERVRLAGCLSG